MKNIYFVEAGFSFDNDVYLPYATGTIAAYLKMKGCFDTKFNLCDFIYKKESTDSIAERISAPFIVGFSCCIWNYQFNIKLAEKIKNKYPECIIVFGGHNISESNIILKDYPFIDILMFGEGEETFYYLLNALDNGNLYNVQGIAFRDGKNYVVTPKRTPNALTGYPSPYLTGIFDNILENNDPNHLLCVLETNRGCPYSCSYCDWCSGKKVRMFPLDKVINELNWIGAKKIEYIFCADSNFGMFSRDKKIIEEAIKVKNKYGYPKVFKTCFAKESNDNVFEISELLNKAHMDKGATLAYQTLSKDALNNINRKNLTLEHFSDLLNKYNEAGIPAYSELILGLPGETRDSFCKGICTILESGQHNSLSIYYLEMLPNSQMSQKSYIAKHKIKSFKIGFNHMHSIKKHDEVEEFSNIVQETATLSKEDWVYCNLFSICVQCFHSLGLLRYISMYLNIVNKISYYEFYNSLLDYILNCSNGLINNTFLDFKNRLCSNLSGDWNFVNKDFGNISWAFEEGLFLILLKNLDLSISELQEFFDKYLNDKQLLNELIRFQKMSVVSCNNNNQSSCFSYDFLSFFENAQMNKIQGLEKQSVKYIFSSNKSYDNWKDYAKEIVWFGRRKGATLYSNRPNSGTSIQKEYLY